MTIDDVGQIGRDVRAEMAKAVVGQDEAVGLMLVALLSSGHLLLEGPPGTAKTWGAQCFAAASGLDYGRIQFTPDLLPGDITGSSLFNFQTSAFTLTKGPIFTELLLADEINRTPPKTQAALLEAMQERRVTIDGTTHMLSPHFTVVATQNPVESEGVYPLPEAQLDRFLFKHTIPYPTPDEELAIVAGHGHRFGMATPAGWGVASRLDGERLAAARAVVSDITLADEVVAYVVALVRATRETGDIRTGASPRAAAALAAASRAHAALEGRDFVLPDDVKALATPALRHRLMLSPAAEMDGRTADDILARLIEQVDAPR